jgi:polyisoprenoid-binding protein YceI
MSTLASFLSTTEAVGSWTLVPERSKLEFANKTMWGLMTVHGRFTEFSGEGQIAEGGTVSGRIVIKAASLATGIRMRDNHLRSADFFDAKNDPDIVVTVNGADPVDGDTVDLRADLTIRGKTVPLPLQAFVTRLDDGAVQVRTTATVERARWDVSGNIAGMVGSTTTASADAVFRRRANQANP